MAELQKTPQGTRENMDSHAPLRMYLMKEILHKAFHVSQVAQDFLDQQNHIEYRNK